MKIRMNKRLTVPLVILTIYALFRILRSQHNELDFPDEEIDIGAYRKGEHHYKWIVVTTIQSPTLAVKQLAGIEGWKIVVVGDRKTPISWNYPGVVYLSLSAQKALGYRTYSYLPYDSYTRKMIGYLYAIEHGAQYIYETDDDNLAKDLHIFNDQAMNKGLVVNTQNMNFNPYPHFGQSSMWPRGYPLDRIGQSQPRDYQLCSVRTPAIQHGLVHGDPDVDAIFRMTRYYNNGGGLKLRFDEQSPTVIVPQHVYAPYNSQNTLYTQRALWSLFLFTSVSDRETDIYRSYWAQTLLWLTGNNVAFYAPYFEQKRNSWHTHANDARDEARLYTQMTRYVEYLNKWKCENIFFFDCVYDLTNDLVKMGFIESRDLQLLDAWISDLASLGYAPPLIQQNKQTCYLGDGLAMSYFPWEQNASMFFTNDHRVVPSADHLEFSKRTANDICGVAHEVHLEKAIISAPKYDDVLLVVSITDNLDVIPTLNAMYKIHFPHILYCGTSEMDRNLRLKWKVSYIALKEGGNAMMCTYIASNMHYHVAGYLHVTQNTFLHFEKMHVGSKNKNQIWVTGGELYILEDTVLKLCGTNDIQCTGLDKDVFENIKKKLEKIQSGAEKLEKISKCLIKAGSDPTFKAQPITATKEITFYLPAGRTNSLNEVVQYFQTDSYLLGYSFLSLLIMECMEPAPEYLHGASIDTAKTVEHYDYMFPFMFKKVKSDAQVRQMYCDYIESH